MCRTIERSPFQEIIDIRLSFLALWLNQSHASTFFYSLCSIVVWRSFWWLRSQLGSGPTPCFCECGTSSDLEVLQVLERQLARCGPEHLTQRLDGHGATQELTVSAQFSGRTWPSRVGAGSGVESVVVLLRSWRTRPTKLCIVENPKLTPLSKTRHLHSSKEHKKGTFN